MHQLALGQQRQRHDPLALGEPQRRRGAPTGTVKSTDTCRRTCSCESTVIVSTRRCRHAAWRVSSAAKPTAISPDALLEDLTRPGLHAARPPARPAPSRPPSARPR